MDNNTITLKTPVMKMAKRNKWQDPKREDMQNRITSTKRSNRSTYW